MCWMNNFSCPAIKGNERWGGGGGGGGDLVQKLNFQGELHRAFTVHGYYSGYYSGYNGELAS